MNLVVAFILNSMVIFSAFFITVSLFKKKRLIEVILTAFTLAFAQIVLVETVLGIFSKLYYADIVATHIVIFFASLIFYLRQAGKNIESGDFSFIFKENRLLLGVSLFLGFYAVLCWATMINPIPYTDALLYHLPYPVQWLKSGTLHSPLVVSDYGYYDPCCFNALSFYPVNAELLFFWLILPLKNAFLAQLGQAPFYLIGIIAIYFILRKFEVRKNIALFSAVLWAVIPNIIKQIKTGALVDVIAAVTMLLLAVFLLELKDGFNFRKSALFGICLGLFIGIKATCIFWSLSILPLFVYFVIKDRKNKKIILYLFIMAACALIFGGRTYIRNLIEFGNIFYPVTVTLFGRVIMPGQVDKETFGWLIHPYNEFPMSRLFFGEGLGGQFLMFIVPGTFLPLIFSPLFRNKLKDFKLHFLFFVTPVIMAYLYYFVMKGYWVRYLFPYLAFGLMATVIFLEKFKWGRIYFWVFGVISLLASCGEANRKSGLIVSFILSLLLFLFFKFVFNRIKRKDIFIVVLASLTALTALVVESDFDRNVFKKFPLTFSKKEAKEADTAWAWLWLDENTNSGSRIAYTGRPEFYPLFGTHFKNDVFYVSINNKPPLSQCYPKGDYRKEKDKLAWENNLKAQKIDYLFVYEPYKMPAGDVRFPIEDEWAKSNTKMFTPVFENTRVRIYRINSK